MTLVVKELRIISPENMTSPGASDAPLSCPCSPLLLESFKSPETDTQNRSLMSGCKKPRSSLTKCSAGIVRGSQTSGSAGSSDMCNDKTLRTERLCCWHKRHALPRLQQGYAAKSKRKRAANEMERRLHNIFGSVNPPSATDPHPEAVYRVIVIAQEQVVFVGDGAPVISAVYMVKPGDAWQLYRIR